jgi:hypothetical protein
MFAKQISELIRTKWIQTGRELIGTLYKCFNIYIYIKTSPWWQEWHSALLNYTGTQPLHSALAGVPTGKSMVMQNSAENRRGRKTMVTASFHDFKDQKPSRKFRNIICKNSIGCWLVRETLKWLWLTFISIPIILNHYGQLTSILIKPVLRGCTFTREVFSRKKPHR